MRNFDVVATAFIFKLFLKNDSDLSPSQWGNVLVITLALIIYNADALSNDDVNPVGYVFITGLVMSSSLGGVLLQRVHSETGDMSFFQQSFFYHFYSMVCGFILMITYDYQTVFYKEAGPFNGWTYRLAVYFIDILPLAIVKHACTGVRVERSACDFFMFDDLHWIKIFYNEMFLHAESQHFSFACEVII